MTTVEDIFENVIEMENINIWIHISLMFVFVAANKLAVSYGTGSCHAWLDAEQWQSIT